ncbi:unnamed protein product [Brassica oleracea var. botrytis]
MIGRVDAFVQEYINYTKKTPDWVEAKAAALLRFSIYIGNKTAKAETDFRSLSGGPMLPMYLDFKTFLPRKSGKRPNLRLDLHPQNKENLQYFEVGLSAGLATFIIVLMRQSKTKNKDNNNVVVFKVLLKQYTYAELKKIKKSFSYTLGRFGTVYVTLHLINGKERRRNIRNL